jgi:3-hydroxybutyrate dehydrogenase
MEKIVVKDRCALVTGGASGIGKEITRTFISNGAKVAVIDLYITDEIKQELDQMMPEAALFYKGDATDDVFINEVVEDIVKKWGAIDILINNAGIMYKALVEDINLNQWKRIIEVNLTAPMICTKKVVPFMKQRRWGRIINISSMMALIGAETYSPYAATKAGLLQLTKVWAIELARDGITVNAICPGWVESPMLENAFIKRIAEIHKIDREEAINKIFSLIPQRRFIGQSEIAFLALFLASEMARGINGAGIVIDTGLTAGMPAGIHRKIE